MTIYCFPPSDGHGSFAAWQQHLPRSFELVSIDYPGYGRLAGERPISDLMELADKLTDDLLSKTDRPFALLGHSMGGLAAFEVALRLERRQRPPHHLIVCACRPPGNVVRQVIHDLPDEQFVVEMSRRIGSRADLNMGRIAALRANVTAAERYFSPADQQVTCALSVLAGAEDKLLTRSSLTRWCLRTTGRFSLEIVPGGHFFRGHLASLVGAIAAELNHDAASPKRRT